MSPPAGDLLASRRGAAAVSAVVVAVFLAVRVALLLAREPFYDELFTLWIGAKPFPAILAALRHDSGPPLFYFLARPVVALWGSVLAVRLLSLAAAAAALALVLTRRSLGPARFTAAALLAMHPAAALFGVDARSYALCALLALAGILLAEDGRLFAAALLLVGAAYCHYYGVLFLPALLLKGKRGAGAFVLSGVLFAPGLLLASAQPPEAMAWAAGLGPFDALQSALLVSRYPASLFAATPAWVVAASLVVFCILLFGTRRRSFAAYVAIPVVLAVAFALAGRNVYFPMRFEAVIAAPLVLWMAVALHDLRRPMRVAILGVLALTSGFVLARGVADHLSRPVDPYRRAATVAHAAAAGGPLVASGYCYLEAVTQSRGALAFPAEQGIHPGWRARAAQERLAGEAGALPPSFVWVGERNAPELQVLRSQYRATPLLVNASAVVARMSRRR